MYILIKIFRFCIRLPKLILIELFFLFQIFLTTYPNSIFGKFLRVLYWGFMLDNFKIKEIGRGVNIIGAKKIKLGENLVLGENVIIEVGHSPDIFIGNNVAVARGTYLRSANHGIEDLKTHFLDQKHSSQSIEYQNCKYSVVIEDDVWIGANCIILSGAHLKKGSIIGAGTVIDRGVESYSIVAGNPARMIASRKKHEYE